MSTLAQILLDLPHRTGTALRFKLDNEWHSLSWQDYYLLILKMASVLHGLGVQEGQTVAIMAGTRLEWSVFDSACIGSGVVSVPIYPTASIEEITQILTVSKSSVLVLENKANLKTFFQLADRCPFVHTIILIEPGTVDEDLSTNKVSVKSWHSLIDEASLAYQSDFEKSCKSRRPGDTITLIFTSGTTGDPKGVVLTHDCAWSEVTDAFTRLGVRPDDSTLSFLPYAHVLGRVENWGHLWVGFTMSYAESIERIRNNLTEIKPTIIVAVPRIFEKVYGALEAQLQMNPVQRLIANKAIDIGKKIMDHLSFNRTVSLGLALQYEWAKRMVLNKIQEAFGGRLRFAVSGGAPLNAEIARFFHGCGLLLLEGYGLTETTAAIAVNTPAAFQFGTVGKPLGDVQIKIAEDGEILVKSRKVMKAYFDNQDATEKVFSEGWFCTGDIGELTDHGYLRITDRKKDLIKTAGGKYVAPQKLEGLLKKMPPISNVLIHGDQKKYIVALLTLDKDYLIRWAKEKALSYSDYETLTQSPAVFELVREAVAQVNQQLGHFETIKRFKILQKDFTVEDGELTPSLKVKRKVLDKKFADEIEKLYN